MTALIIESENTEKLKLLASLAKELGLKAKMELLVANKKNVPNAETIASMDELRAGKGKKFKDAKALFDSIK